MVEGDNNNKYNFYRLPCKLTNEREVTIFNVNTNVKESPESHWYHWIIKNVNNPSSYIKETFEIIYESSNYIVWQYEKEFLYFIADSPDFIKIKDINLDNNNIRAKANYNFKIKSDKNFLQ